MTPTFIGRMQTRIFLVLVIGVPWTLIITLFLSREAPLSERYKVTFSALAVVLVIGLVVWEPIYHGLQQYRWERDWPSMFFLVLLIPEAIVAWFALNAIRDQGVPGSSFIIHIVTTWILMWLFIVGPVRIFMPRYRFRGGRIIGKW